jgi:HD-GYP domain-containing protein (c-di-GMP phosphodiesterase class II)
MDSMMEQDIRGALPKSQQGKRKRILILEDSEVDADLIIRILKKNNLDFEFLRIENEAEFLRQMDAFAPDLILSDINLPGFSGFKALEIVKQAYPELPFIFVSGMVGEDLAIKMFNEGAVDCINKSSLSRLPGSVVRALEDSSQKKKRRLAELALEKNLRMTHEILIASIKALATAMEMRDPYTAGHQRRVADLAVQIAKRRGFSENKIEGVSLAAAVHDIGKIYVPAEILMRPTRLTSAEYELIQVHSSAGYEILKDIEFPWPIAKAVYQHHERLDGSGYPRGLKNEEIIVEARIIMVADVVEAMASHRPYRPALGLAAALEEIRKDAGTRFDPDIVEACASLFADGYQFPQRTS